MVREGFEIEKSLTYKIRNLATNKRKQPKVIEQIDTDNDELTKTMTISVICLNLSLKIYYWETSNLYFFDYIKEFNPSCHKYDC